MTQTAPEIFRFVQMNIWNGRLYYPIDAFLKRERPDILCAQEMLSGEDNLSPSFWTAETLVQAGHFNQSQTTPPIPFYEMWDKSAGIVNAVLTGERLSSTFQHTIFPYEPEGEITTQLQRHIDYYSMVHTEQRLADGRVLHVLSHHNHIVRNEAGRLYSKTSEINFKTIAEYIATLSGPVIFSGDFNLFKESTCLQPLKEIGLTNLNDVHNIQHARNEFSWKAEECVSHVFISPDIQVHDYRVATDNVSDHLPLVMDFSLKLKS